MPSLVERAHHPLHLVVLGRQGSGKGAQCARLARHYGIEHVSTGDVLRTAVAEGTALGRSVERVLSAGALVSDDLVTGAVAERVAVAAAHGRGIVFDGFPRTIVQAERLLQLLAPAGVDQVIHLDVPRSLAVTRLLHRHRSDDTPDVIGRRMSEHARQIDELLAWFDERSSIVTVDGNAPEDRVADRIRAAIDRTVLVS